MKSQSLKWIIGAVLFLVLLVGCGNSAPVTNVQGTGSAGSTAHTGNISGGNSANAGNSSTQVDVTLSPKPTVRPTVAPTKPSVPQPTQPAVVPTTPAVQPARPMEQTNSQSQSSGGGSTIPAAAQAVFNLINQERAGAGLPALIWSSQLVQSAHQHNLNMAAANQLSHQLAGEASFGDRERQAGVNWFAAAENIGYGSGDPTGTAVSLNQSMFAEQPPNDGHRQNILTTSCKMVGVDVVVDSAHNRVWLTEDFAAV